MGKKRMEKRMSGRGFTTLVLCGLLAACLFFGGMVCAVDPYMIYHGPALGLKPVINASWADIRNDEIYKNPGIATYFDYDAVILGSSVTENYKASWFSEAFDCNAVKLSYSNAQSKNFDIILDYVYRAKGTGVKKVFLALDTTILGRSAEETSYPLPDLIYNRTLWSQKEYVLNKNVYCEAAEAVRLNLIGAAPEVDDAYRWEGQHKYGKDTALTNSPRQAEVVKMGEPYGAIEYCKANLANITPYIEAHPETEFYIFFSPYSVLYWDIVMRNGEYEQVLFNTKLAMSTFLEYDNVKLYYFQNDEKIITNLDHYMDFIHFSGDVNRYLLDAMAKDEHRITKRNYETNVVQLRKIVENYDFDGLCGESIPSPK